MSVLIKGLIMPSCCDGCTFSDWSNLHQTASCKLHDYDPCFADHSREYEDKRADFCPLVEVKEPHGRLIDVDALAQDLEEDVERDQRALDDMDIVGDERTKLQFDKDCKQNCMWYLTESFTVIEAEGGED